MVYNIVVVLINTACESGGTGRRARLRGVWETVRVRFPSLAPKQKREDLSSRFCFCPKMRDLISHSNAPRSRIGCANSAKGRSVLARELLDEFSSRERTFPSLAPKKSYHFDTTFFIQTAGLAYHHRTKCGGYHQPFWAVYHHAPACIPRGLMIYNAKH